MVQSDAKTDAKRRINGRDTDLTTEETKSNVDRYRKHMRLLSSIGNVLKAPRTKTGLAKTRRAIRSKTLSNR